MNIDFGGDGRPTIGVEWEFALVDKETRDLSNSASELFDEVTHLHGPQPRLHKELLRNTVELITGICQDVSQAADELTELIDLVTPVANDLGVDLYSAGTHPFAQWSNQLLTPGHRYEELISRTQWWGRQMLIWGVHVHVGVPQHQVIPIVSGLLRWYPHLQALSASSPIWAGVDTGYASNRAMMFQQLPTAGLPFQFSDYQEFEHYANDLITTGVIDEINEIRWDIRPAPVHGTIEIRVCDGVSTIREIRALTALIHSLVVFCSRQLDAGKQLPALPPWHVQENKWRSARYGLDAWIILDEKSNEALLLDDLNEFLNTLEPIAKELRCEDDLWQVGQIPAQGASYMRQRRIAEESGFDLLAVVDSIVGELHR